LALMLLTDARRAARTGTDGELIPLAKQERSLWDRALVDEGVALLSATLSRGSVGPYQLQAAIAAVHDEALRVQATDWRQLRAPYALFGRMSNTPLAALTRPFAVAMGPGPRAAPDLLATLDDDAMLKDPYRLAAVRAHMHEMAGDAQAAIAAYRAAA